MEGFYLSFMEPLRKYLMIDLIGGPRPFQLRHIINLQKGSTFLVMLSLMIYFDNWSLGACIYLANHGIYGILWILKDQIIPDKAWNTYITIPSTLLVGVVLAGYWSAGYIIIAYNVEVKPILAAICTMMHTLGCVLMMSTDTQTHYTLKYKKGLISEGWVARCRNTNYLGEMMLYASYAIMAQHYIPRCVLAFVWIMLFSTNIVKKDISLRKKDGADEYFSRSGILVPDIFTWFKTKLRRRKGD